MALTIAVLAFVIGLAGSFFTAEIRLCTFNLFTAGRGTPNVLVILFWFAAFTWALLFYVRLIAEADEKTQLQQAIHRCPNPRVLYSYGTFCEAVEVALAKGNVQPSDPFALEAALREALALILDFARDFCDPVKEAPRGCNVMLVSSYEGKPHDVELRFFPPRSNPGALRAVLYMPPELVVTSETTPHVGAIGLPVPQEVHGKHGTRICLPGAPFALLTGQLSVQEDTRDLATHADQGGLDGEVRGELAEYFSPTGAGKMVRSFASVRIGTEEHPIGVLNFDYSEPRLLGPAEYYGTFLALISPVLLLLRQPLWIYSDLRSFKVGVAAAGAGVTVNSRGEP